MASTIRDGRLRLYANGSAFADGKFDLRYLESLLTNYRQVVDGTLPIALGQRTLTDRMKQGLQYEVVVQNGSLELLHDIIQSTAAVAAYFAADGSHTLHELIAKLVRDAINIRRAFAELRSNGVIKPMLQITVNNDQSVRVDNNTGTIHVNNPSSILCAEATRAPLDRIIKDIDGERLSGVDISAKRESVELRNEDQRITGQDKEELNQELEILGRLNMVAFDSHRGNLVTSGKSYPVTWDDNIRQAIHDLADREGISFRVRPVIDRRRFEDEPIGFVVVSCRDPQNRFEF